MNFHCLPRSGDLKIKKGIKYGAGSGLFKKGGWDFPYNSLLFYSLQNCVMHLKKNYFFCHQNLMKKKYF